MTKREEAELNRMIKNFGCAKFESEAHYRASKARRLPDMTPCQLMVFFYEGYYEPMPLDARRALIEAGYELP